MQNCTCANVTVYFIQIWFQENHPRLSQLNVRNFYFWYFSHNFYLGVGYASAVCQDFVDVHCTPQNLSKQNEVQISSFKALKNRPYTLVHVALITPHPSTHPILQFPTVQYYWSSLSVVIWTAVKQPGLPSRPVLFELDWVQGALNTPPPPYGKFKKIFLNEKIYTYFCWAHRQHPLLGWN